ncbi:MAG: DMT family transporter [Gammaproteobacteria bacterium]|nr:DMT family transporter [Gammaproteobacteria bacterium]
MSRDTASLTVAPPGDAHGRGDASDPLHLRGVALVLLAGVFWSLGGILIRHVESASDWQILLVRSWAVAVTLFSVLLWRHGRRVPDKFRAVGWPGLVGACCLSVAFICFVFAMQRTTIANATFLLSASPFTAAVLAWLVLREPVLPITWRTMAVAALGIVVMVTDRVEAGAWLGNAFAFGAMLGFSGLVVAMRAGRLGDMLPAVCLAGVITGSVSALLVEDFAVSTNDALMCITMGVVQVGAGMVVFTMGSRHVPAAELALLTLTEVVLAPLWVWVGVGEVPAVATLIGGAIVMAAIVWRALGGMRRKTPPVGAV